MSGRLAVLGTGNMGEAVLAGALAAGWPADRVVATTTSSDRGQARAEALRERYEVETTSDNAAAVKGASLVVLAVKPKDMAGLLEAISQGLADGVVVASIAAGLTAAWFEERLPAGTPVVRAMPNTPAQIGAGVTAIAPGAHATEEHLALVESALSGAGTVVRVAEKDIDAVTALSGSGPAYVFYVIDALTEAGVLLGLRRDVASTLATQTVLGSARLVAETGEHPVLLRERVTSPGGTTAAGLRALDDRGVRAAFLAAAQAAYDRARELR
ncbi:pyrroline-5-carboxylate reductase [Antribacter soli]|nr:pyrroline-5-carboxylate reductase [Antribacter soli]